MRASASPFRRNGAGSAAPPVPFRQRFALETFDEGGVILDVETGNYFELDRAAARICRAMYLEQTQTGLIRAIREDLDISQAAAGRAVEDVTAALDVMVGRNPPEGPLLYAPHEDGYVYRHGTTTVVRIDNLGDTFRLVGGGQLLGVSGCVRAVTPKLLALQGITVLHASAVLIGQRIFAFSGKSGAGKTTTARAFARSGDELISEDLVVLKAGTDSVGVVHSAEPSIRRWQAETEEKLRLDPETIVSSHPLRTIAEGPVIPLQGVSFLDVDRRRGDTIEQEILPRPVSLRFLLENLFLGTVQPARWREHLRQTRMIAGIVRTHGLTVPNGIDALTRAAQAYRTNSTS